MELDCSKISWRMISEPPFPKYFFPSVFWILLAWKNRKDVCKESVCSIQYSILLRLHLKKYFWFYLSTEIFTFLRFILIVGFGWLYEMTWHLVSQFMLFSSTYPSPEPVVWCVFSVLGNKRNCFGLFCPHCQCPCHLKFISCLCRVLVIGKGKLLLVS